MSDTRRELPLLLVFLDLTRFGAQSQRVNDAEIADTLDAYYECVAAAIGEAGGTVVKFVGDGALIIFAENAADRGVQTLLELKESIDTLMEARGWECRLTAKAHFGTVIAGPFGAAGAKRFDVIGKAVNLAAMLDSTGVTLSMTAFRKLGRELRRRFRKQSAPVTYIRTDDPGRFRWTARG